MKHIFHNSREFIKYTVYTAFLLITTLFILYNSVADYDKSHEVSDSVSVIILQNNQAITESVKMQVRKAAHLIEYAALGVAVITLAKQVEKDFGKKYYSMTLFYVLAVAVIDEHIQSFSDRTSSTSDILLDFTGAVIGMLAVLGTMWIVKRIRRIKKGE